MRKLTSLTTKLTVLVALPLAIMLVAAGLGVQHASDALARDRATAERVELALAAAEAARHLSLEGGLSATAVTTADDQAAGAAAPGDVSDDLRLQRRKTDQIVDELQSVVESGGDGVELQMRSALDRLDGLDNARDVVDERRQGTAEVAGIFSDLAEPVLTVERLLEGSEAPEITRRVDAHLALTRAIQATGRQSSLVASLLRSGAIDPDAYDSVVEVATSERYWLRRFESTASPSDLETYSAAEVVPLTERMRQLRDTALAAGPGGRAVGSLALWSTTVARRMETLEAVAADTAADLTEAAAARQSRAQGQQTVAIASFLAALALAFGIVALVYRWVLRPIRRLAKASREAVVETIPKAVELAEADGGHVARSMVTPLPSPSASELSALAEAFNTLQETAVGLAAEGAAARGDVNTVFLNFGRRTQRLVTEQLSHIDNLESRTDNPDTLADLFLLDHLTTRLRRNAESLVVLAGADTPRPWSRPVSAVNVVRAAVAEAADYSRVDLPPMEPALVAGSCANDVSHLLAELIDNALSFSPPESRVVITGDAQVDGKYLITVSDAGTGMSARQLAEANERIARTPLTQVGRARYFGLFVVGRLAKRHDISVRLTTSRAGGVKAEVLLPRSLLVETTQPRGDQLRGELAPRTPRRPPQKATAMQRPSR